MNLLERLLHAVLNRLFERRDIVIDGKLYLRRWYLRGRGTGRQWFLHNIRLPDAGRSWHDHPWGFRTRVLWGGYTENVLRPNACLRCPEPHTHVRPLLAGDRSEVSSRFTHRIDTVRGSTYTLVRAGTARRIWGFWVPDAGVPAGVRWVDWRTYLGLPPDAPDFLEDRVVVSPPQWW